MSKHERCLPDSGSSRCEIVDVDDTPTLPRVDKPDPAITVSLASPWPRIVAAFEKARLTEQLEQAAAVLELGDTVHPNNEWQSRRRRYHLDHAKSHLIAPGNDEATGLPNAAHAAVRALMMLGVSR
jgi:hypothetical protein